MTEQSGERPNSERANTEPNTLGRLRRARTAALAAVVALPPTLNAQNIVEWANSPAGLGLALPWAWVAFGGLDLIAFVCVLETLIQTQQGRKAGAFAALVWLFAGASAYAGYRHGTQANVGRDVKWFFPFMAIAGPLLLHLIIKRARNDKQLDDGRRLTHAPASAYGWARWVPGVGAFGETYCAWRVGRLEGIVRPAAAIARYRSLRPDAGRFGLRVLRALRVEAERQRLAGERQQPKANTASPNGRAEQAADTPKRSAATTVRAAAANGGAVVRPITGARAERIAHLKAEFRDWRTNVPSVRDCQRALGLNSPSSALTYQQELAREAREATNRAGDESADDQPEPAVAGA